MCKGRWHGVSRDGGIGACMGALGCIRKATIPQSASLTPLTRPGSSVAARHLSTLWGVTLYTREPLLYHPQISIHPVRADDEHRPLQSESRDIWPRRGQTVGQRKSVKKNAALLHFLAFSLTDHPIKGWHRKVVPPVKTQKAPMPFSGTGALRIGIRD